MRGLLVLILGGMFLFACSEDRSCDPETYVGRCLDNGRLEICTQSGEEALQDCGSTQVCADGLNGSYCAPK